MPAPVTCHHQVQHHVSDAAVGRDVAGFLAASVLRGEAAVVLATDEHLDAIAEALVAAGVDVAAARAEGRYVEHDARATLAWLRTGDGIDADRFDALVRPELDELATAFGAVACYGEMVGLLAAEGALVTALQLEELWVPVVDAHPLRLLCGYPGGLADGDVSACAAPGTDPGDASGDVPGASAVVPVVSDVVSGIARVHDGVARQVDAAWGLRLPDGAEAAPVARAALVDVWAGWDLGSVTLADDAELLVAELVGNAVRHAGPPATLDVVVRGPELTISVTDCSSAVPQPRDDLLGDGGRGCLIVDALSRQWGVERLPVGKRVWATISPE